MAMKTATITPKPTGTEHAEENVDQQVSDYDNKNDRSSPEETNEEEEYYENEKVQENLSQENKKLIHVSRDTDPKERERRKQFDEGSKQVQEKRDRKPTLSGEKKEVKKITKPEETYLENTQEKTTIATSTAFDDTLNTKTPIFRKRTTRNE
uniref:Uncharacterized protein n=1 Tax=Panagrolaimus superbus TaxID=310955 RepID=A0A914XZZ1_9BILA